MNSEFLSTIGKAILQALRVMPTAIRSIKFAAIFSASLSLVSCIGGGIMRERQRPMTEFNIEKSVRVIHGGNSGRNPTAKEITSAWGSPDQEVTSEGERIWIYDTTPATSGIIIFAYLPLPLMFPSGRNGIDFHFREGATTPWQAVERTSGTSGGYLELPSGSDGPHYRTM